MRNRDELEEMLQDVARRLSPAHVAALVAHPEAVRSALGSIRVLALRREEVAALHHDMQDKPYQANRTLGVLSKMMNLAESWDLRPDRSNP